MSTEKDTPDERSADEQTTDYEPSVAELRDGEAPDIDSHARINARMVERAREELERDRDDQDDADEELVTDGGVDKDAPGTLILTNERGRSLRWHHSVEFDGYEHTTACDRVVDTDEIREVLLDPVESWRSEVAPADGCSACHDSVRSLEDDVATDGGSIQDDEAETGARTKCVVALVESLPSDVSDRTVAQIAFRRIPGMGPKTTPKALDHARSNGELDT